MSSRTLCWPKREVLSAPQDRELSSLPQRKQRTLESSDCGCGGPGEAGENPSTPERLCGCLSVGCGHSLSSGLLPGSSVLCEVQRLSRAGPSHDLPYGEKRVARID